MSTIVGFRIATWRVYAGRTQDFLRNRGLWTVIDYPATIASARRFLKGAAPDLSAFLSVIENFRSQISLAFFATG
ncbi:MAG: hypothetical protein ACKVHE_15425 [Planctomycetales bacterium]